MPESSNAKILLDGPAGQPALGFDRTATALSRIIESSSPQFSIGIFGGWGSGKTTLMNSIEQALPETVVAVEFNAWRYEREPQLLVPLLDTVRTALLDWGNKSTNLAANERVTKLARRVGRVIQGMAAGLSGEVGFEGIFKVKYDAARAVDAVTMTDDPKRPKSLYVAAYQELSDAFREFINQGAAKVVVFVDDLDRCLPSNALEVLESIKLFFDLPGFVFVVGLDENVIQRAVQTRFKDSVPTSNSPTSFPTGGSVQMEGKLARDYVEKIFQVPYRLPPILAAQLDDLLDSMFKEANLPSEQLADFEEKAANHLQYVAIERRINPREVKRFLNTYTLQMLVRPELDRNTVLTLQTLVFRHEWRALYDAILTDSILFIDALNRYRQGDELAFEDVAPDLRSLPKDLGDYLRSPVVKPLSERDNLEPYLSSLESTSTAPPWLRESYQALGRLRGEIRRIRNISSSESISKSDGLALAGMVKEVSSRLASTGPGDQNLGPLSTQLEIARTALEAGIPDGGRPADLPKTILASADKFYDLSERIYRELGRIRETLLTPLES
jgi:hypothetical protein